MAHLLTLLARAACEPDARTAGLTPPIHLSTTFERAEDGSYPKGFRYAREGSPTRHQLEQALATIEGGTACRAFASGLAACDAVLQALPHDAHVVIPDDVYHGFRQLVRDEYEPRGLGVSAVDMADPENVERAVRSNTKLIWTETPSNPMLKITDLRRIATIAESCGAGLAVDGTWATPVLQNPLGLGADIVVHSLTKYIAGHSDVLGGAVVARSDDEFFRRIASIQKKTGAVLDPFSSWLTLRGMRTLGVRLAHQCTSAVAVANHLATHERVKAVYYPGLSAHPGHEVAVRQMTGFGAMLSFEVNGGRTAAMSVVARTRILSRATSLGGTESLIEHRASMEAQPTSTPESLIRISVGLEHQDDLMEDLDRALR